jgi:hypothetical protein
VHKLLYAVLITSRKLRHYFQAHKISVVTSYSLRAVELAEFELDFIARHAIKSQMLTDFVTD